MMLLTTEKQNTITIEKLKVGEGYNHILWENINLPCCLYHGDYTFSISACSRTIVGNYSRIADIFSKRTLLFRYLNHEIDVIWIFYLYLCCLGEIIGLQAKKTQVNKQTQLLSICIFLSCNVLISPTTTTKNKTKQRKKKNPHNY